MAKTQHESAYRFNGTALVGSCIRLANPPRRSVPWHARINGIVGSDALVFIVRPATGFTATWDIGEIIGGLNSGKYEFGQWGDP